MPRVLEATYDAVSLTSAEFELKMRHLWKIACEYATISPPLARHYISQLQDMAITAGVSDRVKPYSVCSVCGTVMLPGFNTSCRLKPVKASSQKATADAHHRNTSGVAFKNVVSTRCMVCSQTEHRRGSTKQSGRNSRTDVPGGTGARPQRPHDTPQARHTTPQNDLQELMGLAAQWGGKGVASSRGKRKRERKAKPRKGHAPPPGKSKAKVRKAAPKELRSVPGVLSILGECNEVFGVFDGRNDKG